MTISITFLLLASVLTFTVQAIYYFDPKFAADVTSAIQLALADITVATTNETVSKEAADQQLQLFHKRQFTENNAALVSKTLSILQKTFNYTVTQLNSILFHETFYAIFRTRGVCVARNFFNCIGQGTSAYRTLDGSCNNLLHPEWGMAFRPQSRLLSPAYDDGVSSPRNRTASGTKALPNPRTISNVIHANKGTTTTLEARASLHIFQWGQFLDHDLISTPVYTAPNGGTIQCCKPGLQSVNTDKCIPIQVPNGDGFFKNGTCMNVKRSAPALNVNCTPLTGPRQQENRITSYIDASNVYGSSAAELYKLRNPNAPEYMAVSAGNNLPASDDNSTCSLTVAGESCSVAGDSRVNVVPSLGSYHTLFIQEHNRIVNILKSQGWTNSEELFNEARKINTAQIQHITYTQFLSWLISGDVAIKYGLNKSPAGNFFTGYNSTINTDIANEFGIAFRIGHSWISNLMKLNTESTEISNTNDPDVKPIEDTYLNPHMLYMRGRTGANRLLKWMTVTKCPKTDRVVEDGARNKLFLRNGVSFDLAALNINRGRDHGIPPYWRYRTELCGESLADPSSWTSLTWHDNSTIALLRTVYESPKDIDLWTGLVSEVTPAQFNIGPTLNCILATQFRALKYGDRYWYERPEPEGFSIAKLTAIRAVTLSSVLCINVYDSTFVIAQDVFVSASDRYDCGILEFGAYVLTNTKTGSQLVEKNNDTGLRHRLNSRKQWYTYSLTFQ